MDGRASDAAQGLVQERFLRVHRAHERHSPDARFSTWLYTTANSLVPSSPSCPSSIMESVKTSPSRGSRIRGSILAGAVGDALGAPIEFDSLEAIRSGFGPEGLRDYAPVYGREAGAITDDTQMTLFVAEGLVLAARAGALHRPSERLRILHRAHLRWLHTQGVGARHPSFPAVVQEGWLLALSALHSPRAPGSTCLAGLRGERMGRMEQPLNTSKGCGA